jgi:hypothetical protein
MGWRLLVLHWHFAKVQKHTTKIVKTRLNETSFASKNSIYLLHDYVIVLINRKLISDDNV